jgi:hypothetical protein
MDPFTNYEAFVTDFKARWGEVDIQSRNLVRLQTLHCGRGKLSISNYTTLFDKTLAKSGITDQTMILHLFHNGFLDMDTRIKLLEKNPQTYAAAKKNVLEYETLQYMIRAVTICP